MLLHLACSTLTLHCALAQVPVPGPLATRLDPIAIASITRHASGVVVGPAIVVNPFTSRMDGAALAFDQFEGDQSLPTDFPPIGANLLPCGAPSPSNRLIFGPTVRNVHFVTDCRSIAPAAMGRPPHIAAFSWYWNPPGASQTSPSNEYLAIDLDWWSEFNGDCDLTWLAGPDCITAARTHICGVRLYYGQPSTPGGHYSIVNLDALQLPPIPGPHCAVEFKYLKFPVGGGTIPSPSDYSTRAQPYLWGTAIDISGGPYLGQPRPGGPSLPAQWNDNGGLQVGVVDGVFSAGECQTYSFAGLCYNPVGPMFAWFYQSCQTVPPFSLLVPQDSQYDVAQQTLLKWNISSAPAGTSYLVEITSESDDSLVYQETVVDTDSITVPAGVLEFCGHYRWRVIASADGTCPSTLAGPRIFVVENNILADFNHDSVVDFFDYLDFIDAFQSGAAEADYNQDGSLDFFDYLDFVDVFASGC